MTDKLRKRNGNKTPDTQQQQQHRHHSGPAGKPYVQAQVVHYKARVSVLDKELTTVSYHGLVNFCLLLLSATLIRLAIENYMKYGILVSLPDWNIHPRDWVFTIVGIGSVFASFVACYVIEYKAIPRKAAKGENSLSPVGISQADKRTMLLHLLNIVFVLAFPSTVTYFGIYQPALGTLVMTFSCIMSLKLYSLVATNFDLRRAYRLRDSKMNNDPMRYTTLSGGHLVLSTPENRYRSQSAPISPESDADNNKMNGTVSRAKDDININTRGNDRVDEKADALPMQRSMTHPHPYTASDVLKEMARQADKDCVSSSRFGGATTNGVFRTPSGTNEESAVATAANDNSNNSNSSPEAKKPTTFPIKYDVQYPNNITLQNFGYFWIAPTLCYQPSYPKMEGPIRKSFLAKRLTEFIVCCVTMYIMMQQFAMPTLVGSVKALDKRDGFWISERILKLSVISAAIWFLGFYAVFHAGLNAVAELIRFSDRAFYLDWWNSVDLAAYWREWNLPIHYFCKRHIMTPLISPPLQMPISLGIWLTFFVSAVMHELLFGIPTHSLKGYSFLGMIFQIPLAQLTQYLVKWRGPDSGLGNAVFWISFCILGQPIGVTMYYYDWVKNNS